MHNNVNLSTCGYGSKILRITAMMLEKAVVWPGKSEYTTHTCDILLTHHSNPRYGKSSRNTSKPHGPARRGFYRTMTNDCFVIPTSATTTTYAAVLRARLTLAHPFCDAYHYSLQCTHCFTKRKLFGEKGLSIWRGSRPLALAKAFSRCMTVLEEVVCGS